MSPFELGAQLMTRRFFFFFFNFFTRLVIDLWTWTLFFFFFFVFITILCNCIIFFVVLFFFFFRISRHARVCFFVFFSCVSSLIEKIKLVCPATRRFFISNLPPPPPLRRTRAVFYSSHPTHKTMKKQLTEFDLSYFYIICAIMHSSIR